MAEPNDRNQLPPGWECRYDIRSGRPYHCLTLCAECMDLRTLSVRNINEEDICALRSNASSSKMFRSSGQTFEYFINHFNRTTTWEDPRVRYWQYSQYMQSQNSTALSSATTATSQDIPMQTGGSGGGHLNYTGAHRAPQIYPTPSPYHNPQLAFLPPSAQELKTPLSLKSSGMTTRFGDMTLGSPTPVRNTDTSFTQNSDSESQVAKINAVFPTVSDTHIRLLLKKYHNRAALVMSALQVEKNPLCAPGPCTPVGVHSNYAIPRWRLPAHAVLTLSPPRGVRPTPNSPKMKLRYLKNVFPKVDETILLDILEQSDNNVQKASEKLIDLGYEKRNPTLPAKALAKRKEEQTQNEQTAPTPPPRMKSLEEKNKLKARLVEKYKTIPDRVVMLAMDSVDYDEERAIHILDIVVAEEATRPLCTSSSQSSKSDERKDSPPMTEAIKLTASPIKKINNKNEESEKSKRSKNKTEIPKVSRGTSTTEDKEYKSPYLTKPVGSNSDLAKGANNDLLLPDYAPWSGPDPNLLSKQPFSRSLAIGRDVNLLSTNHCFTKGPQSELRKGPLRGLAQGSIYSQRNVTNTESRGK